MKKKKLKLPKKPQGGKTKGAVVSGTIKDRTEKLNPLDFLNNSNKPIFVSDPKDKRLQAYNDSLTANSNYITARQELSRIPQSNGHTSSYPLNGREMFDFGNASASFNPERYLLSLGLNNVDFRHEETEGQRNRRLYSLGIANTPVQPILLKERPKEQPIKMDSMSPDLLQSNNIGDIQKIPFTKGSYFSRPRQQQEGSGTDYFDKKTGKLLGTYGNGGKFKKPTFEEYYNSLNPEYRDTSSYNLRQAYNELPFEEMAAFSVNPEANHLPDDYKLPNHPSFSNLSKYYSPGMKANFWLMNKDGRFSDNGYKIPEFTNQLPIDNTRIDMKKNGGIHIKESKKGTFTKAAKQRGKGVQEFASQVLANKDNYSPAMVKKANFAKNSKGWKKGANGLEIIDEPTFNIGDEGYYEQQYNPQPSLQDLGVDIQNPYQFNPSLTQSLQKYTSNTPQLNPTEQGQYNQFKQQQNQPYLDVANQLKQQAPNLGNIPKFKMPQITDSKHWAMANERFGKAQDQFVQAGEAIVEGFTGGLGGMGGANAAKGAGNALSSADSLMKKGFGMKNGGKIPKMMGGGFMSWGNAAAHAASGLGYLGGGIMQSTEALLDTAGNFNINNATRKFEADQYRQFAYNQAENQTPYENFGYGMTGRNPAYYEHGGMTIKEMGGMGYPNVEVENAEHIQLPNGFSEQISGNTHSEGGIPLNLPTGTKVFSDKLKHPETNKKYSKMAKKLETKKDFDALDSKYSDKINLETANLNISLKNLALDKLFAEQEEAKLLGLHGKKVQNEAANELQMKYGGIMKKMAPGGYVNGVWVGDKNPSYSPILTPGIQQLSNNWNAMTDFPSVEAYAKAVGYTGKVDSKNPAKTNLEIQKFVGQKYPQLVQKYHEQYGQPNAGNPYDGKLGVRWQSIAKDIQSLNQPKTAPVTKKEQLSDEVAKIQSPSSAGFKLRKGNFPNINLGIPTVDAYQRDAITSYPINPNFIDPRYLDIAPQLNEINEGVGAINMNIGDRTGVGISNLLQAQTNAYKQKNQLFGQKYNYDRQQDATAQQYNAGAKTDIDKFNLQNYIQNVRNPILQREASIQESKNNRISEQVAANRDMEHEANIQNYLSNIYDTSGITPNLVTNPNNFSTLDKVNYKVVNGQLVPVSGTDVKKYGGKVKILKKKKK